MAHAYVKVREFLRAKTAHDRVDNIDSVKAAIAGDPPAFVTKLGDLAEFRSNAAATQAEPTLNGRTLNGHCNEGITGSGIHCPTEGQTMTDPGKPGPIVPPMRKQLHRS